MTGQNQTSRLSAPKGIEVKICGATEPSELHMLDRAGVDYAGIWFHVPLGRYSLARERFAALVGTPLQRLRCVGVTTENDADVIATFLREPGVAGIQLHGFQLPNVVQSIKRRLGDGREVFKVLHVQRGKCLEKPLLRQYAACGANAFILDAFVSRQQPGSTGERIPSATVAELIDVFGPERLFLAGGMDAARVRTLRSRFPLRGVDIDTAARVAARIDVQRVRAIVAAARGPVDP
jgi:phosphoribosylanthranilate isomerase